MFQCEDKRYHWLKIRSIQRARPGRSARRCPTTHRHWSHWIPTRPPTPAVASLSMTLSCACRHPWCWRLRVWYKPLVTPTRALDRGRAPHHWQKDLQSRGL